MDEIHRQNRRAAVSPNVIPPRRARVDRAVAQAQIAIRHHLPDDRRAILCSDLPRWIRGRYIDVDGATPPGSGVYRVLFALRPQGVVGGGGVHVGRSGRAVGEELDAAYRRAAGVYAQSVSFF